jgi:FkbM family methyltransferase
MPTSDFRNTFRGRRQSWFGLKRPLKRALATPMLAGPLRALVTIAPKLGEGGRLPAPSDLHEVEGRVGDARFVMLHPDRCEVAKELYWGHGRLPRPSDALALDLFAAAAAEADMLVDVGAYTGLFTLAGTRTNPRIRAHAFEIVPEVVRTLQQNCERNSVSDRVEVHAEGVGRDGDTMLVPTGAGGSALPSFYSAKLHFDDGVEVRFRSLDSLADSLAVPSRVVMKIDVEGTEDEVFRSGQEFLDAFKPDMVCEVLHAVADGEELGRLLSPFGYDHYLIRSTRLQRSARIAPNPDYRDWFFSTRTPDEMRRLGVPVAD